MQLQFINADNILKKIVIKRINGIQTWTSAIMKMQQFNSNAITFAITVRLVTNGKAKNLSFFSKVEQQMQNMPFASCVAYLKGENRQSLCRTL